MHKINFASFDLNLLPVFDAIYSEKSITLAGKRLGKTQSAISHSLERLREQLHDELFIKTSQGMRPTSKAVTLINQVRDGLETLSTVFNQDNAEPPEQWTSQFTICMSDYCGMIILPKLLAFLEKKAPKVRLVVISSDIQRPKSSLLNMDADLFIGIRNMPVSIHSEKLFTDRLVCVLAKNHPIQGSSMTKEDYSKYRHIVFKPVGSYSDNLISQKIKKMGLVRDIAVEVPHIQNIPKIISKTQFIATVPSKLVDTIDLKNLKVLTSEIPFTNLQINTYCQRNMLKNRQLAWLRSSLKSLFAEERQ